MPDADTINIDELAELAVWYNRLSAENNRCFMPLFSDEHRYLVLKGGGGSGKSIFAGRKIIERCISEAGHRFLVCRKVARTLRESCFRQLQQQISSLGISVKVNQSDMVIRFGNRSEILFAGLDDVEKLKSIYNITGIWIEEASELLESDFNQLDIRLRGETRYYKQIIVTFNPISIQHWLKKRFFDTSDDRCRAHESTYKDNRFLDAEAKQTLESFRDSDRYYYNVYCLGEWGVTGETVFNAADVTDRLQAKIQPLRVGSFDYSYDGLAVSDIRFRDGDGDCIKIYEDVKEGVPYVIGADTAGLGSDSFVAQVLDNTNGNQVAVLRGKFDEDVFARQLYCLGEYYNTALIGIETNFSTYPVMELERLGYKKQYVRDTVDNYLHGMRKAYGFVTNSKTRPIIISTLINAVREDISIVNDKTTLEEMLTFVRNPDTFKPEAEQGAHDDCIMSLAIAHYIRPQQSYLQSIQVVGVKWRKDQWEDYRNADAEGKKYLISIWGSPKR